MEHGTDHLIELSIIFVLLMDDPGRIELFVTVDNLVHIINVVDQRTECVDVSSSKRTSVS